MSFTYKFALDNDTSLVRFHIGDTSEDGHFLEDETINKWLTDGDSVEETAVRCLKYIITQLSVPNFRADWLTVSNEEARKGYETILKKLSQEFGVSSGVTLGSEVTGSWRADSEQTDADYEEGVDA